MQISYVHAPQVLTTYLHILRNNPEGLEPQPEEEEEDEEEEEEEEEPEPEETGPEECRYCITNLAVVAFPCHETHKTCEECAIRIIRDSGRCPDCRAGVREYLITID